MTEILTEEELETLEYASDCAVNDIHNLYLIAQKLIKQLKLTTLALELCAAEIAKDNDGSLDWSHPEVKAVNMRQLRFRRTSEYWLKQAMSDTSHEDISSTQT